MNHTLTFTRSYLKSLNQFQNQHPDLKKKYLRLLMILQGNPYHRSIRMHPLKGRASMLHSVTIDLDYRITLSFILKENEIIPVHICDSEALY